MNPAWNNFIIEFPFFQLDKSIPFDLPEADENVADKLFEKIFKEYHSENHDKFQFIQSYTQLLLFLTKRHFLQSGTPNNALKTNRNADILLVSRFQTVIETVMADKNATAAIRQPAFYASRLNVHPNHLNAVVKRISGKTASQIIQNHLTSIAKSLLKQTTLSVKEIAFQTHFPEPTHFNAFFKKNTGLTPQQYRDAAL